MVRRLVWAALLACPGVAHADWFEASGKHFVVYSQQSAKVVKDYTEQLERYDAALRVMRHLNDPDIDPANRVSVFIVPSLDVIQRRGGENARGFYQAREHPSAFVPELDTSHHRNDEWDLDGASILRHEYAHHFMYSNMQDVALPLWFVEGYAEFNATAIFNPDGSVTIGQVPKYRAFGLFNGPSVPLKTLFTADTRRLSGEEWNVVYGRGWLLMHYLTFEPSRAGQLSRYVAEINKGKSPLEAARVFGDLDTLDRDMAKTMHAAKIAAFTVPASAIRIAPVTIRHMTAGESAIMPVRIQSQAGVTTAQAPRVADAARRASAAFPADVGVQLALAEAEYDAGDYALCAAAASRAVAADPKSAQAYLWQAKAAIAQAKAAGTRDARSWTAIRKLIVTGDKLDPADPEAMRLFYESFGDAGQAPSANAVAGLRQALAIAPYDRDLRWDVVMANVALQDWASARQTILTIAYSAHPSPRSKVAADFVAAVDGGDSTAIASAAAALRKLPADADEASKAGER